MIFPSLGGRWLPLPYVRAALQSLESLGGLPGAPTMETAELLAQIATLPNGPTYDAYYDEAMAAYRASCVALENWSSTSERFRLVATADAEAPGGYKLARLTDGAPAAEDFKKLVKADKTRLSSYGAGSVGEIY